MYTHKFMSCPGSPAGSGLSHALTRASKGVAHRDIVWNAPRTNVLGGRVRHIGACVLSLHTA